MNHERAQANIRGHSQSGWEDQELLVTFLMGFAPCSVAGHQMTLFYCAVTLAVTCLRLSVFGGGAFLKFLQLHIWTPVEYVSPHRQSGFSRLAGNHRGHGY